MEKVDVLATESLERVRASRRHSGTASKGLIFAAGDSWFDYGPDDVLDKLKKRDFDVECVASSGDTLQDMAYCRWQHDQLTAKMCEIAKCGGRPDVILISGGGNDLVANGVLRSLLNPASKQLPILNENTVKNFVDVTLRDAFVHLLGFIIAQSKKLFEHGDPICILVHGYAHPVPDGFLLKPEFKRQGYCDLGDTTAAMQSLVDRFNDMVEGLPKKQGFEHVKYVNLRHCLSNDLKDCRYRVYWENEMHPTQQGFSLIADEFIRHIPGFRGV